MNEALIDYATSLRTDPYPTPDYRVCLTENDLLSYLSDHDAFLFGETPDIAEDTESTPDDSAYCLTLSHTPGTARLIYAHNHKVLGLYNKIQSTNTTSYRIFHNYLHDTKVNDQLSIPITGKFADTMIMAYELCLGGGGDDDEEGMAGRGSLGLKQLSYRYLNMEMQSFQQTVYPHSLPKLHSFLNEFLDLTIPGERLKLCICGHPQHKGKCPVIGCDPHRAKLAPALKPTEEDKQINLLRRKIATLMNGDKPDPWKLIKGWHPHDHELLLIPGILPLPSIADVPESDLLHYACRDADATIRLYQFLSKMMLPGSPFWLFW